MRIAIKDVETHLEIVRGELAWNSAGLETAGAHADLLVSPDFKCTSPGWDTTGGNEGVSVDVVCSETTKAWHHDVDIGSARASEVRGDVGNKGELESAVCTVVETVCHGQDAPDGDKGIPVGGLGIDGCSASKVSVRSGNVESLIGYQH